MLTYRQVKEKISEAQRCYTCSSQKEKKNARTYSSSLLLLETNALLLVTSALLVVTKKLLETSALLLVTKIF